MASSRVSLSYTVRLGLKKEDGGGRGEGGSGTGAGDGKREGKRGREGRERKRSYPPLGIYLKPPVDAQTTDSPNIIYVVFPKHAHI